VLPIFEGWLLKVGKNEKRGASGKWQMLGTGFRTVAIEVYIYVGRLFRVKIPFPQNANPQIPQTYMVRKSQIRILQYVRKVRKSKKKFQSANLRI
jgi:hypothetical protein